MATRYEGKDYYEPKPRSRHSTEIKERKVYCWGGYQKDLPNVHDSKEKRLFFSVIEIFDIETGLWSQQNTSGNPPLGVFGYSSTMIRNNIYYFGGRCSHGDCRHNSLSFLNVENLMFRELYTTNEHESAPVKKSSSCMISIQTDKNEESLLVVGGHYVNSPGYKQPGAQYTNGTTNEIHIFNVTTGKWITPHVSGRRPQPCSNLTLLSLSGNRVLLYGGSNHDGYQIDTIYISTITGYALNWEIVRKPLLAKYPVGRYGHAATVISGCVQDTMITIGGVGSEGILNECWMINISHKKYKKILLPDNVAERYWHSLSSFKISPTSVLLVVFGGCRESVLDIISDTHVIELVYTNDEWSLKHAWNMTTQYDDYQRRLLAFDLIRKSERLSLSSGEQEEEMIRLRGEKSLLNQQLEVLCQEARQSNTRLQETQVQLQDTQVQLQETQVQLQVQTQQISKDKKELQDIMESHQQEMRCSNARLQETQTQLKEAQVQLQETKAKFQKTQVQTQLISQDKQDLQTRVQEQKEEIHHLRTQFENPHWVIQKEEVQMTQEILGTGGWGEVKVGIFRGTKVAVKCLHQLIISEYNLSLFSREMNIASCIHHPNLLQFIGATRVGNPMILTELMPTSIRMELEKTPLTRSQIINIGHGVASALNYLHLWKPHPILHRDVSSANVLLERCGSVQWKGKLSDYGSANLLQDVRTVAPGSPAYAAPEAQSPNLHSPKMDVYSFGILFAEMATRRLPSGIVLERREQIRSIQWPSIKSLVERCTTQDPQSRPTIEEVLQDINTLFNI